MKFRLPRPRDLAQAIRDVARSRPDEAEAYLDTHQAAWEALAESTPQDAADILEALEPEAAADLIADLEPAGAADVLDEMHPAAAAEALAELSPVKSADLIEEMTSAQAADVVSELEPEIRSRVVKELDDETASEVTALLAYPPDSAGGLMTTEVATLPVGITAGEAIEAVRRLSEDMSISYVYVVDEANRLAGVVSFRDLVFARPGVGLDEVMVPNPVRVLTDTDREVVSELIQRYHLFALPVTDSRDHLRGVVKVGEAISAVQEEVGEDITQMVGVGAEETIFTPIRTSVRRRLPWIGLNLLFGLAIAAVVGQFETTIEQNAILIAYLPLAALLGGNGGAQSLAVIIRAMAVGDVPAQRARKVIGREITVGLINGAVISILAGAVAGLIANELRVGAVVAFAIFGSFVIAALAGSGIPLLLRKLGQDPALAANIFLTLITDIVGFGGFLLMARVLL